MKTTYEMIDEQTKFGAVAQTKEDLSQLMIAYARQAVQEAADRIYEDVSNRIFQDVLSVKDDLL